MIGCITICIISIRKSISMSFGKLDNEFLKEDLRYYMGNITKDWLIMKFEDLSIETKKILEDLKDAPSSIQFEINKALERTKDESMFKGYVWTYMQLLESKAEEWRMKLVPKY